MAASPLGKGGSDVTVTQRGQASGGLGNRAACRSGSAQAVPVISVYEVRGFAPLRRQQLVHPEIKSKKQHSWCSSTAQSEPKELVSDLLSDSAGSRGHSLRVGIRCWDDDDTCGLALSWSAAASALPRCCHRQCHAAVATCTEAPRKRLSGWLRLAAELGNTHADDDQ
eukprot:2901030-Rhodomonas_salina.1